MYQERSKYKKRANILKILTREFFIAVLLVNIVGGDVAVKTGRQLLPGGLIKTSVYPSVSRFRSPKHNLLILKNVKWSNCFKMSKIGWGWGRAGNGMGVDNMYTQ
jgi:hypothetical protein